MPRSLPITFEAAVRLLAGDDRKLIGRLDKVLGVGILLSPLLTGSPAAWSLVDPKNEFMQLVRMGIQKARGAGLGTRSDLLVAANTILVVAAFFDAARDELGPAWKQLQLTDEEKRKLASRAAAKGDGKPKWSSTNPLLVEVPIPAPQDARENTLSAYREFYHALVGEFISFVEGLAVWDRIQREQSGSLAWRLRNDIPARAVDSYDTAYRRLAVEVPEFYVWASLQEHEATRQSIRKDLKVELKTSLATIHRAISASATSLEGVELLLGKLVQGTTRVQQTSVRHRLRQRYEQALDRPLVAADWPIGDREPPVQIPSVRAAYVNPCFRAAVAGRDARVAEEGWWQSRLVRGDIQGFLAGHLTSPQSTTLPLLALGHPGSGKSLLTKVLAARLPEALFTPIRVELRRVSADAPIQMQIEQQLLADLGEHVHWSAVRDQTGEAIPVVLLDGFDELLQATGTSQSNYLELVRDFQEREAELGQPVVVVVTSRTVVADKARIPAGTLVVKLEAFSDKQIGLWLNVWNRSNRDYFASSGLKKLAPSVVVSGQRALACQPLLLLLLSLYDADGNALQSGHGKMGQVGLYERLLFMFLRREVLKRYPDAQEEQIRRMVEEQFRNLGVVAFGMFNRGLQVLTDSELDRDLSAFSLNQVSNARNLGVPLSAAELLLGRFFFVYESVADLGTGRARRSYEFLHATFGEYLLVRLTSSVISRIWEFEQATKALASGRVVRPPEEAELFALLSFEPLAARAQVLSYLDERLSDLPNSVPDELASLLERLLDEALQWHRRGNEVEAYQPRERDTLQRLAILTLNLLLLRLFVTKKPVDVRRICKESLETDVIWWSRLAKLWAGQLDATAWDTVAASLEVVEDNGSVSLRWRRTGASDHAVGVEDQILARSRATATVTRDSTMSRLVRIAEIVDWRLPGAVTARGELAEVADWLVAGGGTGRAEPPASKLGDALSTSVLSAVRKLQTSMDGVEHFIARAFIAELMTTIATRPPELSDTDAAELVRRIAELASGDIYAVGADLLEVAVCIAEAVHGERGSDLTVELRGVAERLQQVREPDASIVVRSLLRAERIGVLEDVLPGKLEDLLSLVDLERAVKDNPYEVIEIIGLARRHGFRGLFADRSAHVLTDLPSEWLRRVPPVDVAFVLMAVERDEDEIATVGGRWLAAIKQQPGPRRSYSVDQVAEFLWLRVFGKVRPRGLKPIQTLTIIRNAFSIS